VNEDIPTWFHKLQDAPQGLSRVGSMLYDAMAEDHVKALRLQGKIHDVGLHEAQLAAVPEITARDIEPYQIRRYNSRPHRKQNLGIRPHSTPAFNNEFVMKAILGPVRSLEKRSSTVGRTIKTI
jgi:hypothetical protein